MVLKSLFRNHRATVDGNNWSQLRNERSGEKFTGKTPKEAQSLSPEQIIWKITPSSQIWPDRRKCSVCSPVIFQECQIPSLDPDPIPWPYIQAKGVNYPEWETDFRQRILPCTVHDNVNSMCNCQNSTIAKIFSDGILDQGIRFQINGCRRFVQNQNFCFPQKSSCQTNQLSLANAIRRRNSIILKNFRWNLLREKEPQVFSAFRDQVCQPIRKCTNVMLQMGVLQSSPHLLVTVPLKRIQIYSKRSTEQHGLLMNQTKIHDYHIKN
jgi:hypothetical protein